MIEIFSAEKCREMDSKSINEIGIPSIVLMENAAIQLLRVLRDKGESFLILCGKGNNGGDALALSRHLILEGKKVKVCIISGNQNYSNDFRTNFNIIEKLIDKKELLFIQSEEDIDENFIDDLNNYDVVVDGIFGVGLNNELTGMFKKVIEKVNMYGKFIAAIDVPSGLDSNFGIERGASIRAHVTYTFEVIKRGFLKYKAINYVGKIKILKIGIPEQVKKINTENTYILEEKEYKFLLPKREVFGHKGDYGRALVFAGRSGFTGAAFITTECTVRAGAGLTTLICDKDIQGILANRLVEAMTSNFDSNIIELIKSANSIALGPGFGIGERQEEILKQVIDNSNCPIVIDADGITLLGKNKKLLKNLKNRAIITPHPGELARFLETTVEEVEDNRSEIAKEVANKYGIVVLLKGYNAVISNGKEIYINSTGNSKMASGGMGDALTGIINAFISQGVNIENAALLGAYIHGKIADRLGEQVYIINARDIINELPTEINNILVN
ncbi:bifunctional ADP-dependent NAD(P)H-hydrate dehydratase/NAD(P)H-hydrate epimerase [Clostridium saccharoperbutylacetonicum]|uniref:bifunctional ADP-dependent NAD(P)H-hydrate dehydratase/NAD(P)H-hydrate epimerase n=1 Tax=Clostridium saccharoperbutylacetonicum TaxID=36745 RepID=UPI000983BE15|nr:bifunctional ADP-dependent NAD(P)H-hydrate dehydratase/NAD(P)H-hydrate epimerase [Clostridium saccharoperbutylacetonicum]AQR97945.1 bifunctional NAD(P)H-hydrate repair enzyme Nnr [Clostridium saccharoperbutylacetonicum]NSB33838.1 NAD(P)H-hydrate epimerase [Clostridium saccharoperbutylacetonicum]